MRAPTFWERVRSFFCRYYEEDVFEFGWEPAHWRLKPWAAISIGLIGLGLLILFQYICA
jgi:hypothetical protein